ncbi:hypothetical protein F2P81_009477 [Scophthalmus maximus]|uniref:C-type lectin domain-containing protein n=1 Tax=Scophthalmus maximus TaxID=52904 RepID=A0A6A4SYU4_SCOMX|nr:hypothetical protein F2P81_009477 [Scophthalmus maximus]
MLDPHFVFVNEIMDWSSAQSYCRENVADLATLRSDTDNLELQDLLEKQGAWIGLFRYPNIYWSDRSGYSFRHWDSVNNPLDSLSVICGVTDLHKSGKWKLFPCDRKLPFVCYSIPPPAPGQTERERSEWSHSEVERAV